MTIRPVYAYAREDLDTWQKELARELTNGFFGENITTTGIDVTGAVIGERWRGRGPTASSSKSPSRELRAKPLPSSSVSAGGVKTFTSAATPGAYTRVIEPGTMRSADSIELVARPDHGVTIGVVFRAMTLEPELLPEILAAGALPAEIKELARRRAAPQLTERRVVQRRVRRFDALRQLGDLRQRSGVGAQPDPDAAGRRDCRDAQRMVQRRLRTTKTAARPFRPATLTGTDGPGTLEMATANSLELPANRRAAGPDVFDSTEGVEEVVQLLSVVEGFAPAGIGSDPIQSHQRVGLVVVQIDIHERVVIAKTGSVFVAVVQAHWNLGSDGTVWPALPTPPVSTSRAGRRRRSPAGRRLTVAPDGPRSSDGLHLGERGRSQRPVRATR